MTDRLTGNMTQAPARCNFLWHII